MASKTQIDRLGERLKKGNIAEADLRLLDDYRRSFTSAYQSMMGTIRAELGLDPTGRLAKSTQSIVEKLRRESIRLSQVQDVVGCRIVVHDVREQDQIVEELARIFSGSTIVDRRMNASHGYRAVHVIARLHGKLAEIQVRTKLQHLWAELSEKLADAGGIEVKYGGGPDAIRTPLASMSALIAAVEQDDQHLRDLLKRAPLEEQWSDDMRAQVAEARADSRLKHDVLERALRDMIVQHRK